jgi:hypothetical protein
MFLCAIFYTPDFQSAGSLCLFRLNHFFSCSFVVFFTLLIFEVLAGPASFIQWLPH